MPTIPIRLAIVLSFLALPSTAEAETQLPPTASRIASAVLAAPAGQRADATVLGADETGEIVTLRVGSNQTICLADDPSQEGFHVACYHSSLEPFMARGRALRAAGVEDSKERREHRWKEMEAGALAVPKDSATLHILEGSHYDADRASVENPYRRWVIYVPYATAASTGLSTEASDTAPWLMVPGTPTAHIMVTPPRP